MTEGPYAVVLEFQGPGGLRDVTPERLHAAFLGLVNRGDRALGKLLHSPQMGRRPFSLHPLGPRGRDGRLRLRLAVLAPELFSRFWERWEARGGIPLKLGGSILQPVSLSADGPWCGARPWKDFLDLETQKEVAFLFATPTTFKAGDLDLPLPVPRLVFGGLLRKWNSFSPYPLGISPQEIERKVALADARLRTKAFYDGRSHITGFVGHARFRLLRGTPPEVVRAAGVLTQFAFFAGVGRKTTHGMGLIIPGG